MAADERLIYRLMVTQQKMRGHIRGRLKQAGVKATLVQSGLLFLLLEKNGRTMSSLSSGLALDNSTLTGLVDRLQQAGLVERRPDPRDRRQVLVWLTAAGEQECRRALPVIKEVNQNIAAALGMSRVKEFIAALERLDLLFEDS